MRSETEYMKMAERVMDETVSAANVAMAQSTVALDTMMQLQSDERKEKDRSFLEALDKIEARHAEDREKDRKHYRRIILALALTLALIIGAIIGGVIYIVSNFDFEFQPSYSQSVSAEGGGDSTIEAGINVNWPSPTE